MRRVVGWEMVAVALVVLVRVVIKRGARTLTARSLRNIATSGTRVTA